MSTHKIKAISFAAAALCFAADYASAAGINMNLSDEETVTGTTGSGAGTVFAQLPAIGIYGNSVGPSAGDLAAAPGFSFYDDYVFTVAAATVDSVTSEINLGNLSINNLEERLYSLSGQTLPVVGTPTGFQTAWTTPVSFQAGPETGMLTVMNPTTLAAGTYVLEIRGDVTGSAGGSYSGQLDLNPVPLPAALPMLLSGLGLLGGMFRKRFVKS